jgi:hypothetical protein
LGLFALSNYGFIRNLITGTCDNLHLLWIILADCRYVYVLTFDTCNPENHELPNHKVKPLNWPLCGRSELSKSALNLQGILSVTVTVTVSVTVSLSETPVPWGTGMIVRTALPGFAPPATVVVGLGVRVRLACDGESGWATGAGDDELGAGIWMVVIKVLLWWMVTVTVPMGGEEGVGDGGAAAGGGLGDAGGGVEEGASGKPEMESVVLLANAGGDELEDEWELVVGDAGAVAVALKVKPSSLAATAFSAQPTNTPCVVFIGRA